ncbi:MAG: L,D-transpeptidase [Fibrobacteria bacterium]|nr:L,D-transpeptidase [Fibrobacteria bacterium]
MRPPRLVLIDEAAQTLRILEGGREIFRCAVSTGANGMGCREGSGCTPWGWHTVREVVGYGEPAGARFVSRVPTGEVWTGDLVEEDWILTRVVLLDGAEPGVNRGGEVDSASRYIYIHGTNREDQLGMPASHGCVRVSNASAELLGGLLSAGDPVFLGPRGNAS